MADTYTPALNLVKPQVGSSVDTWGEKLNSNMDKIDVSVEQASYIATALDDALVGMVVGFPLTEAPTGWLKANGATVSRTTYAKLFARIGTTFGAGNGSTTFKLPDYRGYFPRWLDDGAQLDPSRTLTSGQGDQNKRHDHTGRTAEDSHSHSGTTNYDSHTHTGQTSDDNHTHGGVTDYRGDHEHSYSRPIASNSVGSGGFQSEVQYNTITATTSNTGGHAHNFQTSNYTHRHYYTTDASSHNHAFGTLSNTHSHIINDDGGSEARPINKALLACIKY